MKRICLKILAIMAPLLLLPGCALKGVSTPRIVDLQNGICQDTVSGKMWQRVKSEKIPTIEAAREYAKNQTLGGYHDWRLPTVYELYDLHYLHDLHLGIACDMDLKGNFWSDEKDGEGMVGAWEISDQCDPVRQYSPAAAARAGYVRVVRP